MSTIASLIATPIDARSPSYQVDLASSFQRYDELDKISQTLSNVSSAKLSQERSLADLEQKNAANATQLRKNRETQPRTARRLDRNAHPHFFHYLQINRDQKVKQLEKDLETLKIDERRLEVMQRDYEAEIQEKRASIETLKRDEGRARSARVEKDQIIEQVVGNSTIPNHVGSLRSELMDCENQLQSDAGIVAALDRTMAQVNQARQLFERAHQELLRANRDNRAATYEAEAEMFTVFAENDYYEVAMQRDRDRMINLARQNAFEAGNMLQAAFDSFPMEARVRFPEITRNICNAAIPNLMGANYGQTMTQDWIGGAYGAFRNDRMAQGKINQNIAVLLQCEQLAAQQAASLMSVIAQVRSQQTALDQRCASIKERINSEKNRVFQLERQSISFRPANYIPQQSAPHLAMVF